MSTHRYPATTLAADYVRSTIGLILCAGPLMLAQPIVAVRYVLGGVAVLFALFGLRTLLRQLTRAEVSDIALSTVGPFGRTIAWDDLTDVELRYFSVRRDREKGWMQLRVLGKGGRVAFDSALSDFVGLARRVLTEAERRGCPVSPASRENLTAATESTLRGSGGFSHHNGPQRHHG